jgi:hypothetical protein
MLGKKKLLLGLALVVVMLAGGITAGTQLLIQQPVSASIKIEGIGGSSPSFNIIDNAFADPDNPYAGAAAGYISSEDVYVIGFGANIPGGDWALSFGRSQTADIGNGSDFVFKLENNYDNDMTVSLLKTGGNLGDGTVIKLINVTDGNVAQWTLTGADTDTAWTLSGDDLTLSNGSPKIFSLRVENTDAVAQTSNPGIRFMVTAD